MLPLPCWATACRHGRLPHLPLTSLTPVKLTLAARVTSSTVGDVQTLELVGGYLGNEANITIKVTGKTVATIRYTFWKQAMENRHTVSGVHL